MLTTRNHKPQQCRQDALLPLWKLHGGKPWENPHGKTLMGKPSLNLVKVMDSCPQQAACLLHHVSMSPFQVNIIQAGGIKAYPLGRSSRRLLISVRCQCRLHSLGSYPKRSKKNLTVAIFCILISILQHMQQSNSSCCPWVATQIVELP